MFAGFPGAGPGGCVWGGPSLPHLAGVPERIGGDRHRRGRGKGAGVVHQRGVPRAGGKVREPGGCNGVTMRQRLGEGAGRATHYHARS